MSSAPKPVSLSFELFPPKAGKDEMFWTAAETLSQFSPSFMSVTCGAGGTPAETSETADLVCELQSRIHTPAAAHLTAIGKTRAEVDTLARNYWDRGIRRIVALRGDTPNMQGRYTPNPDGYAYASDLVAGLKAVAPFDVSVAGYPETHPEAASAHNDMENLKRKVDAGADRIITQFFFDHSAFCRYRERAIQNGINVPIVPGILPIMNFKRAKLFSDKCNASIPPFLSDLFSKLDDDDQNAHMLGLYFALQQCQLLHEEGVDVFHFFTLNSAKILKVICFLLQNMEFKDFCHFMQLPFKNAA